MRRSAGIESELASRADQRRRYRSKWSVCNMETYDRLDRWCKGGHGQHDLAFRRSRVRSLLVAASLVICSPN